MAITVCDHHTFCLKTRRTVYVLKERFGFLERAYYGALVFDDVEYLENRQKYNFTPYGKEYGIRYIYEARQYEYSGANTGDFRTPALVVEKDGDYGCRLRYRGYELTRNIPVSGMPTTRTDGEWLKISLADEEKEIEADLYYLPMEDCDCIVRFAVVKNVGESALIVDKAASLQTDIEGNDWDILCVAAVANEEMRLQRFSASRGTYSASSRYGSTGYAQNPFLALCEKETTETSGDCYGFNLLYSGNFKTEVEYNDHNSLRIVSGINDETFRFTLEKGESFITPQAVCTFSENGIGQMSRNFHDYCREYILPPRFAKERRPIVANTWESYYFDIDEEKLLRFAETAKRAGANTVVLDDGWFRDKDDRGLGDWNLLEKKFPSGLSAVAEKIHAKGLSFGLWFEPEMINEESELFRRHPEWVLGNGNERSLSREQTVLDMSNPHVTEYLYQVLSYYISSCKLDYIKWDANRYLSEVGSRYQTRQGETWHRYLLGLYGLLDRIEKNYPDLFVETCSGGGARFDLGMLYYSPMIWLSDNTDPYSRTLIQKGASVAYPLSTFSAHLSLSEFYGKKSSLYFKNLVLDFANFGMELDLTKQSDERIRKIRSYADRRERVDEFVLRGDLYRLKTDERYYHAFLQVKKDKSAALFTFVQTDSQINYESVIVKLCGLDENARYRLSENGAVYYGRTLEKAGLRISDLLNRHWGEPTEDKISLPFGKCGSGISFFLERV